MNPEQQRIAIAEACGWSHKTLDNETYWWHDENNKSLPPSDDGMRACPNYLNDLNAMHEAEETLDASQCAEYARQLMKHHPTYCVTVLDNRFAPTEEIAYQTYQLLHATATQRAEAFLRTIGKWEESK